MPVSIRRTTVGAWKVNTYLIEVDGVALLVDPGDEFDKIRRDLINTGTRLVGIVSTHAHFDHVGAVQLVKKEYHIPFYMHSEDEKLLKQANLYRNLAGGKDITLTASVDRFLDTMVGINVNDQLVKVIHTPGHTNGSVSLVVGNCAIVGDLFFQRAIGRTDLPGGSVQQLQESIRMMTKRYINFEIYPGHGDTFVLNEEVIRTIEAKLSGD